MSWKSNHKVPSTINFTNSSSQTFYRESTSRDVFSSHQNNCLSVLIRRLQVGTNIMKCFWPSTLHHVLHYLILFKRAVWLWWDVYYETGDVIWDTGSGGGFQFDFDVHVVLWRIIVHYYFQFVKHLSSSFLHEICFSIFQIFQISKFDPREPCSVVTFCVTVYYITTDYIEFI